MAINIGGVPIVPSATLEAVQRTTDVQSLLSKGQEEFTFGRQDTLKARRNRLARHTSVPRNAKLRHVLALLNQSRSHAELKTRLHGVAKRIGKSNNLSSVQSETADPFEQLLILEMLSADLGSSGERSESLLKQLDEAKQRIDEDHAVEVRAKMNAFEASLAFGHTQAESASFRENYLALILSGGSLSVVLDEVLRLFRNRLRQALKLLIQTLGQEIDSQWTSMEPEYLHLIRQQLYEAGLIANVLDECESLTARLKEQRAARLDDSVQMTRDLLDVAADAWPIALRFTQLAEKYVGSPFRWRLRFLNQALGLVRGLPDKLFEDDESRDRLFQAAQDAVDAEAAREDL
jgi:type III secretion system TyeA family effector delivery regulator